MKMARMVSAPADVDAALIREIASGGAGHRDAISGRGVRIGPELLGEVQLRCEQARDSRLLPPRSRRWLPWRDFIRS